MVVSGVNWASEDIANFIKISDQRHYKGAEPETGIFLDIGGNIGTTSIYCKKKLKSDLKYIAFEPILENAKLFAANAAINGLKDIIVEQIALSNCSREKAAMHIAHDNWGGSGMVVGAGNQISESGGDEIVATITLDSYLSEHHISAKDIKYIWIDVEGHEPEVLEGAAQLYNGLAIPTCLEFNQNHYMAVGSYEKMVTMLSKYFSGFFVCEQVSTGGAAAPYC